MWGVYVGSPPNLPLPFISQQRRISEQGEEILLGGRNGQACGTWLASSKDGMLTFITNVRELQSIPQAKTRGHLPVRFLQAQRLGHNFKEVLARGVMAPETSQHCLWNQMGRSAV